MNAFTKRALIIYAVGLFLAVMLRTEVQNASWRVMADPQTASCLPWSMYVVHAVRPVAIRRGDIVVLHEPALDKVIRTQFAIPMHQMGSMPPAAKMVAGLPGDTVEIRDRAIWVNGNYFGKMWLKDWAVEHFPELHSVWASGVTIIPKGKVLLMGTQSVSFDGRYIGLANSSDIEGAAWPL